MAETQINNQNQETPSINVPPPPKTEVVVRTMQSDIKRLGIAGGGAVAGQKVAVSGPKLGTQPQQGGSKKVWIWVAVGAVAALALFAVGFFLIPAIL